MPGIPQLVVAATAVWTTLYLILRQVSAHSPEWTVRVVTIVHAILITTLAVLDCKYFNPPNMDNLGQPNTRYEEGVLSLTLGYFVFDLLWVLRFQTEGPIMYLHHATSILSISFILASGVSASESLLSVSLLEGTNPCLQTRWFLRTHGYKGTWIHTITEFLFMISFLLMRVAYGSKLTILILQSNNLHPLYKLGAFALYLVSLVFVYQMFSYIVKKYCRKESKKNTE